MAVSERNPFDEDEPTPARGRPNPFGEAEPTGDAGSAAKRVSQAARRIRGMRSRLGAEGLTPAATRDLIDEIASALEAIARGLRATTGD